MTLKNWRKSPHPNPPPRAMLNGRNRDSRQQGAPEDAMEDMIDRGVPATAPRNKIFVVVVDDSLLRRTEAGVCGHDRMSWKVCCLPWVEDQQI